MSSDIETSTGSALVNQPGRKSQALSSFDEFDQWFDEVRRNWLHPFFMGRGAQDWVPSVTSTSHVPRLDIIDRDDHYCVRAELPGVDKDGLNVSLEDNVLNIQASTHKEEQEEKGRYFRRELSRGEYQRVVRLPSGVDSNQVKATFRDGILEMTLQKTPGARRQTIAID
jgi:HSP20 family protein